jgi:hypothetical protein
MARRGEIQRGSSPLNFFILGVNEHPFRGTSLVENNFFLRRMTERRDEITTNNDVHADRCDG